MKYTEQEVREAAEWNRQNRVTSKEAEMLTAFADLLAAQPVACERVYLVNTGEIMNGVELYERHDQRPPMADVEVLYTAPSSAQPVAVQDGLIDKAAQKLAESFDYPWQHMPEQGREDMRGKVRDIAAMLAATPSPAAEGANPPPGFQGCSFSNEPQPIGVVVKSEPAEGAKVAQPVAFIQPNHLQNAKAAPFLCRVAPTQIEPDFVPLYVAPFSQPAEVLSDERILELFAMHADYGASAIAFARAIERAVLAQPRQAWTKNAFDGPPPDGYASWYAWMLSDVKSGARITSIEHAASTELAQPSGVDERADFEAWLARNPDARMWNTTDAMFAAYRAASTKGGE